MKKILILCALPVLFSCQSNMKKETAQLKDSLATADSLLHVQAAIILEKQIALSDFVKSFNEIQDNLNKIKEKEKIISYNAEGTEFAKSSKEQIISDIQFISDKMSKNEQKLAAITQKLKDSNIREDDLEKSVVILAVQMSDKNAEIMELRTRIEKQIAMSKEPKKTGPLKHF